MFYSMDKFKNRVITRKGEPSVIGGNGKGELEPRKQESHTCSGVKRKLPNIDEFCDADKADEQYPPLFAENQRTKFVAYKTREYHHSPSNIIGANYRRGAETPDTRTIYKPRLLPINLASALKNILQFS